MVDGTRKSGSGQGAGPAIGWLAVCFLLAGLGTVVLGPILPAVAARWGLTDAQSGTLFLAKFATACVGGMTVSRRLRRSLFVGASMAGVGFALFAVAPGVKTGALCLAVTGFGLGQMIAAANIVAGRRFREHTGSALAGLNFFFSLGAVVIGVLVAKLLPRLGLNGSLVVFAALFAVCALGAGLTGDEVAGPGDEGDAWQLRPAVFAFFCGLLFLYGGLETALSSWLTTFSVRFAVGEPMGGQTALVVFWAALAAGRVVATGVLRRVSERAAQGVGLAVVAVVTAHMALAHGHATGLVWECVLMGLGLAAYFPAVFAMLMRQGPSPREAGTALAVSGLGAAVFPWMMGAVSTASGSLRPAMWVPAGLAVVLLLAAVAGDGRRPVSGGRRRWLAVDGGQ